MLIDVLVQHPRIVINTDIDGLLSGLLLHHYLGCEVVGFSNSWDCVWIDKNKLDSPYDGTYIDLFVSNPDVISIEQHIIAVNNEHLRLLKQNSNKINPNLERDRIFDNVNSYKLKYPFGTFHYLCALLEGEGLDIDLDLDRVNGPFKLGDFITRADDALFNSYNQYRDNAWDWWDWLLQRSSNGKMTNRFIEYIKRFDIFSSEDNKKKIDAFCRSSPYYSEKKDGEYKFILAPDGTLLNGFMLFVRYLSVISGLSRFDLSARFTPLIGRAQKEFYSKNYNDEFIYRHTYQGESVFSYSFIRRPNSSLPNFSYTLQLK